uniref:DNA polymerase lambda isoform X2 n=1 Tax=Erigeron canadensis TaxID=72917 RepID=UPI001CB99F7B|nr:DNA polymerase lambda isoform X2 [Erigeron canadensis]
MAPKARSDPNGIFSGMVVFLVDNGVQRRRLQIWQQKLVQLGAIIEEENLTRNVTHIFALNSDSLEQKFGPNLLRRFKGVILLYQWLEDSLRLGEKVSDESYTIQLDSCQNSHSNSSKENPVESADVKESNASQLHPCKKLKSSPKNSEGSCSEIKDKSFNDSVDGASRIVSSFKDNSNLGRSPSISQVNPPAQQSSVSAPDATLPYHPPDLNRNITEIFSKLINIYRALGEDRRSFSYYKAIPVIERLPFKVESVDQVKDLPGIGKSMQDHIHEIVTTGKLSKLEHFESDEKVQEMDHLLQKAAQDVLPGVSVVCGGSYRRGKATCGDLDIIVTHPDGKSHIGFLPKYVNHLKDMNFLREDLVFSIHSEQDTDSGIDTYFGLCTYPGQELRHRIDLKVYPKDIYPFGLIHWTGNDVVNRRLRILAESKGFRLDDNGLFPATHGSGGKRVSASTSLKFNSEKEVFEFLGFPWLEPHERNI